MTAGAEMLSTLQESGGSANEVLVELQAAMAMVMVRGWRL